MWWWLEKPGDISGKPSRAANHFGHPGKLQGSPLLSPYHVSLAQPNACLQMHSQESSPGYAVKFGRNHQLCKQAWCVNSCDCHCQGVTLQKAGWVNQTLWHCGGCHHPRWVIGMERSAFWEFMHFLLVEGLWNVCRETRGVRNLPQNRRRWQNPTNAKLCPHRTFKTQRLWPMWTLASLGFPHLCVLASSWMPQTFRRPQSCIWPHCHPWQYWCQTLQDQNRKSW